MKSISVEKSLVYKSLTGRRYMTINGAAKASASWRIRQKYPTESPEYECGRMTYEGFHFSETDWGKKMFRRLFKFYVKQFKAMKDAS